MAPDVTGSVGVGEGGRIFEDVTDAKEDEVRADLDDLAISSQSVRAKAGEAIARAKAQNPGEVAGRSALNSASSLAHP
jgi:hypothetical protein